MAFTLFAGGTLARNDYTITSPYVNDLKIKRDHDRLKMGEFGATLKFPDHYFDKAELEFVGYYSYKETQGIQTNIRHARTKIWTAGINPKLEKNIFVREAGFEIQWDGYLYAYCFDRHLVFPL